MIEVFITIGSIELPMIKKLLTLVRCIWPPFKRRYNRIQPL